MWKNRQKQGLACSRLMGCEAEDAAISGFDKETGTFLYTQESPGKMVDQEQLTQQYPAGSFVRRL